MNNSEQYSDSIQSLLNNNQQSDNNNPQSDNNNPQSNNPKSFSNVEFEKNRELESNKPTEVLKIGIDV